MVFQSFDKRLLKAAEEYTKPSFRLKLANNVECKGTRQTNTIRADKKICSCSL